MSYLGSWKIDDLLTFPANTHRFDTGNATDADSPPAYRVYEDETSTPLLTGSMALLDDANTTGLYSEQITLSAANGFEKGKCYTVYISATVNGVTGTMSHTFQLEAEVDANVVSDKTGYSLSAAAIQAIWDALTSALSTASSIGKLLVDNINATISSRASQTSVDTIDDFVDTEISTILSRLGTPSDLGSGANLSANLVDIEGQTDDIGVAGAGLSAIPWNAAWDAEVQSEVDDALVARALDHLVNVAVAGTDIADDSIIAKLVSKSATADWDSYANTTDSLEANRDNLGTNGAALSLAKTTNITGFNDLSAAQVNAEADTALSDVNLDHLVGTATGIPAVVSGTYLDQIMDDGTAVYDRTTDSLQAIRDRGDAAWDTADVSALALQSSVDDLEGRLTAARAGYLDNLNVGGNVASAASISALNNLSAAQVNAEVVDALNVDTYTEPGQEAPPATTTLVKKIGYLYKAFRNRKTQTVTTLSLYADDATTVDQKATISDDGTTYTHGELGTGP